jgi:crotonobetainyl-CoA:carnitine CoA-transferase CaiB-like acyl-CoA transferase
VMSITGEPDGGPMRFPVAIADMTTGIYAAMGILGALFARERNGGHGDFLDMALFDSQLTWLANAGSSQLNSGVSPARWGNAHPNIVPYQPFRGSDDRYFVLGVGTQPAWHRLMILLKTGTELEHDPRFHDNASRVKNREQLIPLLQKRFAAKPAASWVALLAENDIPGASIQTVGEALMDPQTQARGLIVELEHPTLNQVRSIANPIRYQQQPIQYRYPPPLLGEHTTEIREQLGYL